jgi:hypothetical protein
LLAEPGSQAGFTAHVSDHCLHLVFAGETPNGKTPVVDVVSPELEGFELDNRARAVVRGHFDGQIYACLTGSSAAAIEGTAGSVAVHVDGSSNLTVALNGPTLLSGSVDGASNLVSDGTVRGLDLHENGSSVVSLARLTAPTATASVDGSSWLDASGSATNLTTSVGGDSVVSLADLNVKSACVSAGGSSQISLGLSQSLSASAVGSSKITYKGTPSWLLKSPSDDSTILSN